VTLRPGLTASMEYRVPARRTVPHLLPESAEFAALPPVLATGYLVGQVEWACMRALGGHLADGEQTLGVHVDLSHEAPTPPGGTLTIRVELVAVDGRQLTFAVEVADEAAVVCRGTHRRAVIDRARFDRGLSARGYASGSGSTSSRA
jgi:fluoroacetyl-CoA thioesterase